MFKSVLGGIQKRVEGTLAVSLMSLDGIAVETINTGDVPLESLSAEFGSLVKLIRSSNMDLDKGEFEQFSVMTSRFITLLFSVTSDYFILMVLSPDGNQGRARYELKLAKTKLKGELI